MRSGMINLYKESGYTSSDAVAKLRGILHYRKIGHTGTLDPAAEGVLPLCIGAATKVCELLTAETKEYVARMRLGVTTDTQDATGIVLTECPVTCSIDEVKEAAVGFVGGYHQLPPMYSAKKIAGKKLYEYARSGAVVERKPVWVGIDAIEIIDAALPEVSLRVTCSRGTYIRTLCHDIGDRLGCGACMTSLVRTRVGRFLAQESVTFAQIEAAVQAGEADRIITPVDALFLDRESLKVKTQARKWLYNGNPLGWRDFTGRPEKVEDGEIFRVYDPEDVFWALYRWDEEMGRFRPHQMFPDIYS